MDERSLPASTVVVIVAIQKQAMRPAIEAQLGHLRIPYDLLPFAVGSFQAHLAPCDVGVADYLLSPSACDGLGASCAQMDYPVPLIMKHRTNANRVFAYVQLGVPVVSGPAPEALEVLAPPATPPPPLPVGEGGRTPSATKRPLARSHALLEVRNTS